MELREKIIEILENMDNDELVNIHNEYCYNANYYDNEIMDAYRLEEYLSNGEVMNWLNRFYFGEDAGHSKEYSANPNRNYFTFNGYGNIISFDYARDYVDIEAIADYIEENNNALYNDEIQAILDELESEED